MTSAKRHTDWMLFKRVMRQVRPYWLHIGGIFFLSLLSTPLALLTPVPLKFAVDFVIGSQPIPTIFNEILPSVALHSSTALLIFLAVLIVSIALLTHLQEMASSLLQTYAGEKMSLDFRAQLFHCVQRLSLSYHDVKGTSDSTFRIQYDAPAIQYIATTGTIPFITAGITLVAMISVISAIDWQLALIALTISPILYFLTQSSRARLRARWTEVKEVESSVMSVVQETLGALRVVKAFGRENQQKQRYLDRSKKSLWGYIHLSVIEGTFDLFVGLTIAAGTAATLMLGVLHVNAGLLTLGDLLLVMAYLAQLYGPLRTISQQVAGLQSSLASVERAFTLLDQAPDVIESPNAKPLNRALGNITFHQVCFEYNQGYPVLHDISFQINTGSRVGIAGKTGSGKTTLVNLLTRFYDPTAGQILLDDIDLRDYRLSDLRNQFGIVLQDPLLFSTTIAENIAYGKPEATEEEILRAAKLADAHDFITCLPRGYQTQVGERGMALSGGERQRIALARAFLKDAPILILDEPTSSVDIKTEATIMDAMERLVQGRTTFMIAHRLSTLKNCDFQLQIEKGHLTHIGTGEAPLSENNPQRPRKELHPSSS